MRHCFQNDILQRNLMLETGTVKASLSALVVIYPFWFLLLCIKGLVTVDYKSILQYTVVVFFIFLSHTSEKYKFITEELILKGILYNTGITLPRRLEYLQVFSLTAHTFSIHTCVFY